MLTPQALSVSPHAILEVHSQEVSLAQARLLAVRVMRVLVEKRVMRLVDRAQLVELVGEVAGVLSGERA